MAECDHRLSRLWQAIKDNTKGDMFWIGEILLGELQKETGFNGWCPMCGQLGEPRAATPVTTDKGNR